MIASVLPDKGVHRRVHRLRRDTKKTPCLSLRESNELIRSNVALVFGSFLGKELADGSEISAVAAMTAPGTVPPSRRSTVPPLNHPDVLAANLYMNLENP